MTSPPLPDARETKAPDAALSLAPGLVTHARLRPAPHRFRYRVFNILIDIDRLDEANRACRLFSVGRFNLAGFDPRDHGAEDGAALRAQIDSWLAEAGLAARADRVLLWCYPRILGHVFDPLSIYFAYRDGRLEALIYAVRNTFGERHAYVAPINAGEFGPEGVRQSRDKLFYVSPFVEMAMRYHFRIRPPGERLTVRILETDREGPLLSATFSGAVRPLTGAGLLAAFLRSPLLSVKILGGIHFEALRLWLKGVRLVTRPAPPPPASFPDVGGAAPATRRAA